MGGRDVLKFWHYTLQDPRGLDVDLCVRIPWGSCALGGLGVVWEKRGDHVASGGLCRDHRRGDCFAPE